LFIAGFVLLLVGLFGSRFLAERATKLLSSEEKLQLLDSFPSLRVFGSLPLALIVFSFLGISYLPEGWMWPAYLACWGLLAIYFFIIHRAISRKLGELAINTRYLVAYNRARWVSYSGFTAFFILNTLSPFLR
jgi:hypothetical protein